MTFLSISTIQKLCLSVAVTIAMLLGSTRAEAQCSCNFTVTPGYVYFDGAAKGVKGGDVICVQAGSYSTIQFVNVKGSAGNPVIIKNCGGQVLIGGPTVSNGMLFGTSRYVHVTGTGVAGIQYGLKVIQTVAGSQGVAYAGLSSDVEIDHMEIAKAGYTGIMAKTDPSPNCADVSAVRPNFTLYNVSIHDNYIHDCGGEGIYMGDSFYNGTTTFCGQMQYCHEVRGARIYNNRFENTGREAIQLGAGVSDNQIYNNKIYNYGTGGLNSQNGGIQLGLGTVAKVYNNFIKGGSGPAIAVQGIGNDYVYNNVIVNPGQEGITINTRPTTLATDIVNKGFIGGVLVMNNTFVNAIHGAIIEYQNDAPGNVLFNNLMVGTSAPWDLTYAFTAWQKGNNIVVPVLANAKFENPGADDYRLVAGSPAINVGKNVAAYGVTFDADKKNRPFGTSFDISAYEYTAGQSAPIANAGADKTLTLPTITTTLTGTASDADGTITTYAWTKQSGPAATLLNAGTATLSLSALLAGTYVFRLTVTDNSGLTAFDEVTVTVSLAGVAPVVSVGADKTLTLPTNTITLTGTASDVGGSITAYAWTKQGGPAATLTNASTTNVAVSGLVAGTYFFRLTVTDNSGLTAFDEVKVTVSAAGVAPVVSVGADKTLTLPTNTITLTGTASDVGGSITAYAWTKQGGPAATLTNASTANVAVSGLVAGTYFFRLTVTDNSGLTAFDEVKVTVNAAGGAPVSNAGPDVTLTLPVNSTILYGMVSDAGGWITSYAWTKQSGPAATLTNASTQVLTLGGLVAGTYVFRLTVTDNRGLIAFDDVTVTVSGTSVPPIVVVGADKTLTLPANSFSVTATASDPNGTIAAYSWTKVSGPAAAMVGITTNTLSASGLLAGTYVFRLTVTDNSGLTASDDMTVTVISSGQPPVVNVGADKTLTLPSNSLSVTATASDPDGTVTAYSWTKQSGPTATMAGSTTNTLSASSLLAGTYVFRLTVTDNSAKTAFDELTVIVNPVATSGNVLYRINAGGGLIAASPMNWAADTQQAKSTYLGSTCANYTCGTAVWGGTGNTTGAPNDIFGSNRYSPDNLGALMQWSFPVAPGTYEVRLFFAETPYAGGVNIAGARRFSVAMEGVTVLNNYDIFGSVGMGAAKKIFTVAVTDGMLSINFIKIAGKPQVNGIEILSVGSGGAGARTNDFTAGEDSTKVGNGLEKEAYVPTEDDQHPVVDATMVAYPNPFHDKINIQFQTEQETVAVSLMDLEGHEVYRELQNNVTLLTLDMSRVSIANGTYILVVKGAGAKFSQRVMKL